MTEKFLNIMLDFMKEAGSIAMNLMEDSQPRLKADSSVVTKADLAISQCARQHLQDELEGEGHILIDEETHSGQTYFQGKKLHHTSFIWALDPIDGTRLYANRMPLFAVSLGLLKNCEPWLGAVYFPALEELFYCDGIEAYWVKSAFKQNERKEKIRPVFSDISSQSIFLCHDRFFEYFRWQSKDCHVIIPACAAVDLCWPTVGRGCGSLLKCHLWDFAGAWPIIQKAGLQMRSLSTGEILDKFDIKYFDIGPSSMKMRDFYLLSSDSHFEALKQRLRPL